VLPPPNARNPFCNPATALPLAPRASLGVLGSAGSAFHVKGPAMPVRGKIA
jgi:hypothetical protein